MPKRKFSDSGFKHTPKTNPANKKFKSGYQKSQNPMYATVPRTRGIYAKGETKYFDTFYSPVAPGGGHIGPGVPIVQSNLWVGNVAEQAGGLCCPAQGTGISQRIGREIYLTKIKIRGFLSIPPAFNTPVATTYNNNIVRLILVQDMQTNGTLMLSSDLQAAFDSTGAPAVATDTEVQASFQNLNNFGRFRVLKDKHIPMVSSNMTVYASNTAAVDLISAGGCIKSFKFNVNFKEPVKIRFNSTATTAIAAIVDNSFHILANTAVTVPVINMWYSCRSCYRDPG